MRLVIVAAPISPAERATERDEWPGAGNAGAGLSAGGAPPDGRVIGDPHIMAQGAPGTGREAKKRGRRWPADPKRRMGLVEIPTC